MNEHAFIIIMCISVVFLAIIFWVIYHSRVRLMNERNKTLTDQLTIYTTELEQERQLVSYMKTEKDQLLKDLISLESDYKNLHQKYMEHVENNHENQERFENLANRILDEKAQRFDIQHRKGLKELLDPLKERIQHFEERMDKTNKDTIERHVALKTQILQLTDLNEKITTEAKNLTQALKGDNKTQGNWGELILESILDRSGLEKGREYTVQDSFKGEDGRIKRPDVIIHLPGNKKMIIDSKVSLTAYEKMMNAVQSEVEVAASKAHTMSVKSHIDSLSSKNYHKIYEMESPDFVLMFIPIDTAFSAALRNNPTLYGYAFERNIVIVTPSTLLATLKMVDTMWQNEKQQRYALEIAGEAGKMYDKFSAFISDLQTLGSRLDQAKRSYVDSMNKLTEGRGDLVSRAEKIKQLGAKANKSLPKELLEKQNNI